MRHLFSGPSFSAIADFFTFTPCLQKTYRRYRKLFSSIGFRTFGTALLPVCDLTPPPPPSTALHAAPVVHQPPGLPPASIPGVPPVSTVFFPLAAAGVLSKFCTPSRRCRRIYGTFELRVLVHWCPVLLLYLPVLCPPTADSPSRIECEHFPPIGFPSPDSAGSVSCPRCRKSIHFPAGGCN